MSRGLYDAVIVGAGHNGLVAAAYLARAGQRVLVLERRPVLGGAAATETVVPGFQFPTGAHDLRLLLPQVVADLDLPRHGLKFVESPTTVLAPQPDGPALVLYRDVAQSQASLAPFSAADARQFPAFLARMRQMVGALEGVLPLTPPRLTERRPAALLPWMRLAAGARRLGRGPLMELLRVLPMPVADLLDEWFESPALKGVFGAAGVLGGPFGPSASGTAFMLLYQRLGPAAGHRFVRGGPGQLAAALAAAAQASGAGIQAGVEVTGIELEDDGAGGRATGVRVAGGDVVRARVVLSSATPSHTLLGLVGAPNLEPRFVRQVRGIRYRGSVAKLNLALSALPQFAGLAPGDAGCLGGHILVSPSLEYLERAADAAKYGQMSPRPLLDAVIPTVLDPSLAPTGRHVLSVVVQWAPYHLRPGGWDDAARAALAERVVSSLAEYAPGLPDLVLHQQVITPLDWERDYSLTEGNPFHGEMGLDQLLFMRPVPGYGQYRAPIAGLYLCGAGAHPGGGVTGAPGYNAARQALAELRQVVR